MKSSVLIFAFTLTGIASFSGAQNPTATEVEGWDNIRNVTMAGDLRAFWDIGGAPLHESAAVMHGFDSVNLLNDYSDYPGKQKRNITTYLRRNGRVAVNPWDRPEFFEEILRQNIKKLADHPTTRKDPGGLFVHDIEFEFEQDIAKAFADPATKKASGASTLEEFQEAYLAKWAEWFWLPCKYGKDTLPDVPAGLYGPQPFRRDYWGIAGKDAAQIDGTHALDGEFWKYIDPHVDFYIASIYVFYDDPGSIFYMASNVEENFKRTRQFGDKPVYAYSWLRFHNGNKELGGQELKPWIADAMAVVPYFYGAKGNVLWGWEPQSKGKTLYGNLPVYTDSLGRVADLSAKIAMATPVVDDAPAHVLWKGKQPLLKRLQVSESEWIVLAMNPWQAEDAVSNLDITCGTKTFSIELLGRHCDVFHITGDDVKRLQVDYKKATSPVNTSVL